ncbi:class I SAM-dependent methyltransferase [Nonomuraea sp. NPDC049400]|uniref:class I SAM-dependent methyltransferase n=1 Tax=Nonomuraea sp. NPDC049400 TaxID=3364352 RepID=UPI003799EBB8
MSALELHLGCGPRHIPGFLHIDAIAYPHVDRVGPVEDLSCFDTGSVDSIYASHVLEHFGRHDYLDVLAEWFRVLRPGGILRIGVPDFQAIAEEYVFGRLTNGLRDLVGLCVGGQHDRHDYHKMIFDEDTLEEALAHVGFSAVRRWDWRSTRHAHIDDYTQAYLPHMDKERGRLMSLNMEAVK